MFLQSSTRRKSEVYCQLLLYSSEKSLYSMFDSKHRELITILIVISLMLFLVVGLNTKAFAEDYDLARSWRCKLRCRR